jgi:hypothetical protein
VAVKYFTRWVEAKLLTNASSASIKKFFWQNIICRYGVPRHIIVDNIKYFDNVMFKDFCHQIGMKVAFALVYHLQTNGAEVLIFEAIKKILEGEKKGKWAEVMPQAVWSHNTTVCRATNFTSFWLMYGAELVLPEEEKHQSLRTATATPTCPSEAEEKDLLESDMLKAVANLQKHQEETRAWRDPKVKLREFEVGNSVLLRSPRSESTDKLEAKWIGLYVVTEKTQLGTYRLSDPQGRVLEHSWNTENLRHFSFKSKLKQRSREL